MKRRGFVFTCCFALLLVSTILAVKANIYKAYALDDLSPKEQLQLQGFSVIGRENGDEAAYEYIVSLNGDFSSNV